MLCRADIVQGWTALTPGGRCEPHGQFILRFGIRAFGSKNQIINILGTNKFDQNIDYLILLNTFSV